VAAALRCNRLMLTLTTHPLEKRGPCTDESDVPFSRADFAWEFLRRNRAYQALARHYAGGVVSPADEESLGRPWGLRFIADPTRREPVFWRAEVAPDFVVRLTAAPGQGDALPDLSGLLIARRREASGLYLKLVGGLQIHVDGELVGPVAILTPPGPALERSLRAARALRRALTGQAVPARDLTSQQRLRLRQTLVAIDARRAGRSYREIAREIFGEEAVARHVWRTSSVRDAVIRLVRGGQALAEGNHLRLLSAPGRR